MAQLVTLKGRVNRERLKRTLPRLLAVSRRTVAEEVERYSRGLVKRLFDITPPANADARGTAAREQGEAAIVRDLMGGRRRAGIFAPMDPAMLARFESVASKREPEAIRLFVTKRGDVYGVDRALYRPNASVQEMRDHHLQYFRNGRMSSAGGRTRDVGRWKFIDKMVVAVQAMQAYVASVFGRVGKLASGWIPLADALGATIPAWIKRHRASAMARGAAHVDVSPATPRPMVRARCSGQTAGISYEMQRRADYAVGYQINAMIREAKHIFRERAAEAKRSVGV